MNELILAKNRIKQLSTKVKIVFVDCKALSVFKDLPILLKFLKHLKC